MKSFNVLGIDIAAVQIEDVIGLMDEWILQKKGSYFVCMANVHNVMRSIESKAYKSILDSTTLVVPDGMSLIWLGRAKKFHLKKRVYAPDLMLAFCALAQEKGYSSFFYGGAPGIPEKMAENLKKKFPGLQVVGTYSPPFRPLTSDEDKKIVQILNNCSPDVLWVGLGCPKQDYWIAAHKNKINTSVMIGVGAAFDFFAGQIKQAPRWIRDNGLEWLFRLLMEPKRLWRRYLLYNPKFVYNLVIRELRLRRF